MSKDVGATVKKIVADHLGIEEEKVTEDQQAGNEKEETKDE